MRFCPVCGNLLLIDATTEPHNVFCRMCTFKMEITKKLTKKIITKQKKVDYVINKDSGWGKKTENCDPCSQCGNKGAYFEEMQTRSADEPATIFYKCANSKCGYQWKEG